MLQEIECFVHGRVQGVMYRDFARRQARRWGLTGTAENLPDGSVRVLVQGDEATLHEFIGCLKHGSLLARVESVAVSWREASDKLDGFQIIG